MKLPELHKRTASMVRSVVVSPHYLLLIQSDNIYLVKVSASSTSILFQQPINSDFPLALERCLEQFTASKHYWGQTLEVIINDHQFFIYSKYFTANGSNVNLQNLRTINSPDMQWSQHVITTGKRSLFVLQAIDKTKLKQITDVTIKLKVSIFGITTLAAYVITHGLKKPKLASSLNIQLNGKSLAEYSEVDGNIIYSSHPAEQIANQTVKSTIPFHELEFGKFRWHRLMRSLRIQTLQAKQAQIQTIAQSSLRLLNAIFAVFCLFLGVMLIVVSLFTNDVSSNAPSEVEYEALYAQEQIHDSLLSLLDKQQDAANAYPRLAPCISLFFQNKPNGAYLRTVTARTGTQDSLLITADGIASNERAVFAYQNSLEQLVAPLSVDVLSIKPEAIVTNERVDSVTSFTLQLVLNNALRTRNP